MKYRLEIPVIVASFKCPLTCQRKGTVKCYAVKISGEVEVKLLAFFSSTEQWSVSASRSYRFAPKYK